MPNWVSTTMSVTGSREELQKFLDGILDDRILDSYVPCPAELRETVSGWSNDEAEQAEREKKYQANIAKYGYKDWYDWQYEVWGTKWGDCDTHIEPMTELANGKWEVSIYFQTAWGSASNGFRKVSAMFPTLRFIFEYDEEAGFFAGVEAMENGVVIFDEAFAPCEYDGEIDYDSDESIDKYEEWKSDRSDEIWKNYEKVA